MAFLSSSCAAATATAAATTTSTTTTTSSTIANTCYFRRGYYIYNLLLTLKDFDFTRNSFLGFM
jgi:hypothetical protein